MTYTYAAIEEREKNDHHDDYVVTRDSGVIGALAPVSLPREFLGTERFYAPHPFYRLSLNICDFKDTKAEIRIKREL